MTNRLTPVGSRGRAEASLGWRGVLVQIAHDDIIGNVARGGREVAPYPGVLAPEALADVLELLLDLARDERPLALRTKSQTRMWGGISTNLWT